jgi:hypothetical protein
MECNAHGNNNRIAYVFRRNVLNNIKRDLQYQNCMQANPEHPKTTIASPVYNSISSSTFKSNDNCSPNKGRR